MRSNMSADVRFRQDSKGRRCIVVVLMKKSKLGALKGKQQEGLHSETSLEVGQVGVPPEMRGLAARHLCHTQGRKRENVKARRRS